jgi:hypothetical protein
MCSLNARSGRPIQASLLERTRASLEGAGVTRYSPLLAQRAPWKGLVGSAQLETKRATLSREKCERAWGSIYIVRRAQSRTALADRILQRKLSLLFVQ